MISGTGDDRLTGWGGNDTLDGGAGSDTAVYRGNRSDYQITRGVGQLTVADQRGGFSSDGIDTLSGIERLQFADGVVVVNFAPVVTVANKTPAHGQSSIAGDALYASIIDVDVGDTITKYRFFDGTVGNGRFLLNGTPQVENLNFEITAAQLSNLEFRTSGTGSDVLWIQASDGYEWSDWKSFTVNAVPNAAPMVNVRTITPHTATPLAATALWSSITDADGDAITQYRFYDDTVGNGRLMLGATPLAERAPLTPISAANIGTLTFTTSSTGSDLLWVQAYDGYAWSEWEELYRQCRDECRTGGQCADGHTRP